MWIVTLGLATLAGCGGDDNNNGGTGGSAGSGGTGTGGTVKDAAPDSDAARADVSTADGARPDATSDVSTTGDASDAARADAASDVSTTGDATTGDASDAARADAAPDAPLGDAAEAGDGGLTPLQARGQYLVDHVIACPDCHTPQGPTGPDLTHYMAGNANFVVVPTADGGVARLGSRNLTNDATGLKNRTDDEIKALFMNGMRPAASGGGALNPIMPYYVFHNVTAADADAIVAYLRVIPAVVNTIPQRDAIFDVPGPANYLNPANIPTPALGDDAAQESALRGRYLAAESGLCIECHTQHLAPGPDAGGDVLTPGMYFAGGEDFSAFFAATLMIHPVSKNLTSDGTTGLGNWVAQDIVTVLKMGRAKDGTGICPPMPVGPMGAYGGLTDGDALDIANYIKSLPAIVHNVPDMCVFPPVPPDAGPTEAGADSTSSSDTGADSASTGDAAGD